MKYAGATVMGILGLAVAYWIFVDGYVKLEAANESSAFQRAVQASECHAAVEKAVSLARKSRPR